MKRHYRPYGCTFTSCDKSFGSKNDWKRHEYSQHFRQKMWRCDVVLPGQDSTTCSKVCDQRTAFKDHLLRDHSIAPKDKELSTKIDKCRVGQNFRVRFWCGFCKKIVELGKRGLESWNERFDHIGNHIEKEGAKTYSWMPVDIHTDDL